MAGLSTTAIALRTSPTFGKSIVLPAASVEVATAGCLGGAAVTVALTLWGAAWGNVAVADATGNAQPCVTAGSFTGLEGLGPGGVTVAAGVEAPEPVIAAANDAGCSLATASCSREEGF